MSKDNEFPKLLHTHTVKVDNLFVEIGDGENDGKTYAPVLFVIVSVWEATSRGKEGRY